MKKDVAASASEAVAPKNPIFSDKQGFVQVADIHHLWEKGKAQCRFGENLRV